HQDDGGRVDLRAAHGRRVRVVVAALAWLSLLGALGALGGQGPGWMFGPFEKPQQVNPVLRPNPAATFLSPVNDSIVRWEEYATFNPAAVVRGGKVYVLYRTTADRKSTRLNSSHVAISYAVFCLKKKKK